MLNGVAASSGPSFADLFCTLGCVDPCWLCSGMGVVTCKNVWEVGAMGTGQGLASPQTLNTLNPLLWVYLVVSMSVPLVDVCNIFVLWFMNNMYVSLFK